MFPKGLCQSKMIDWRRREEAFEDLLQRSTRFPSLSLLTVHIFRPVVADASKQTQEVWMAPLRARRPRDELCFTKMSIPFLALLVPSFLKPKCASSFGTDRKSFITTEIARRDPSVREGFVPRSLLPFSDANSGSPASVKTENLCRLRSHPLFPVWFLCRGQLRVGGW